jgi:comEA protein
MKNGCLKGIVWSLVGCLLLWTAFPVLAQTKSDKEKININTASLAELQKLPRIGPVIAQKILDYRKENGNFKKIEDLLKIQGIGEKTFNQLKDMVTVGTEASSTK